MVCVCNVIVVVVVAAVVLFGGGVCGGNEGCGCEHDYGGCGTSYM